MNPTYPPRGTAPDKFGYPHYQEIEKTNIQFEKNYKQELQDRVKARIKNVANINEKTIIAIRSQTQKKLSKLFKCKKAKLSKAPELIQTFATYTIVEGESLKTTSFELLAETKKVSFSVVVPQTSQHKEIIYLCIPDTALNSYGIQSKEETIKANIALLKTGCALVVPHLESIKNLSSTLNKGRILEGSSVCRDALEELASIANILHTLLVAKEKGIGLAGTGFGANMAIFLKTFYDHFNNSILKNPVVIGQSYTSEYMLIPAFNIETDMLSLLLSNCNSPTLLQLDNPVTPLDSKSLNIISKKIKSFTLTKSLSRETILKWLKPQKLSVEKPANTHVVFDKLKKRIFNINNIKSEAQFKTFQKKLKLAFKEAMCIKKIQNPLKVEMVYKTQTEKYLKTEYHVTTEKNCKINMVTIFQKEQSKPLPTILCLPGSGSDVAKCENTHAAEIIERGWNAVIIDARVALYQFHPSIAENMAIISQSVKDILACNQWIFKQKEIDPSKVAVTGGSQGGTHSWMVAALDERIAASAPMVGFCTFKSLLTGFLSNYGATQPSFLDSHSIYYYVPSLVEFAEQQDLCSLIAPRPLMILGANQDSCFPMIGIQEGIDELSSLYKRIGYKNNLKKYIFEGPHSYDSNTRAQAYQFFDAVFKEKKQNKRIND